MANPAKKGSSGPIKTQMGKPAVDMNKGGRKGKGRSGRSR